MSSQKTTRHCPECGTVVRTLYQPGGKLRYYCDHCYKTMRPRTTIGPDQPSAWVTANFPPREPVPEPAPMPQLILPAKEKW